MRRRSLSCFVVADLKPPTNAPSERGAGPDREGDRPVAPTSDSSNHDTMDVVWHDDKRIECNPSTDRGRDLPFLTDDLAVVVQLHVAFVNVTEQHGSVMRADR